MRTLFVVALAVIMLATSSRLCFAQRAKALKAIVKVLTGAGAAEAARRSGQSFEEYKHEDAILTQLRSQGVDADNSSVCSVYFKLINDGGYWADFWSKPDVF
ncbi:MAG: hypothetical protein CBB71_17115, partial [Rhodopirellula sp. TMED11]